MQSTPRRLCAVSDINENTSNTHVTSNEPQIIATQKGKPKLCYRGYMYHLHPARKVDCLRWRCTERAIRCVGTVVTGLTVKEPQVTIEHIHPADNAGVQVAKEVVRMKKLAVETREKPAVIIAQALQRLPDAARGHKWFHLTTSSEHFGTVEHRSTRQYRRRYPTWCCQRSGQQQATPPRRHSFCTTMVQRQTVG